MFWNHVVRPQFHEFLCGSQRAITLDATVAVVLREIVSEFGLPHGRGHGQNRDALQSTPLLLGCRSFRFHLIDIRFSSFSTF